MLNPKNKDFWKVRQRFLQKYGYKRAVDGVPGNFTKAAIKKFQEVAKKNKWYTGVIDSSWGVLTEQAYQIAIGNVKAPETQPIKSNQNKNPAPQVQRGLTGLVWERQPDDSTCGPTSLRMVLRAIGVNRTVNELATCSKTRRTGSNKGTNPSDLKDCANSLAGVRFDVENYKGMAQIKNIIDNGFYIILHGNTNGGMGYKNTYGHYYVIGGYNLDKNQLHLYDPSEKKLDGSKRNSAYWIPFSAIDLSVKSRAAATPVKIVRKR
jgi:hypothetical protein